MLTRLLLFSEENDEVRLVDWANNQGITRLGVACQKGSLDSAIVSTILLRRRCLMLTICTASYGFGSVSRSRR
jgi:hypothetical protein